MKNSIRTFASRFPWPSEQSVIAFMLITIFVWITEIQTIGVGAFFLLVAYYSFVERKNIVSNVNGWFLVPIIAFGLLSVLWSDYPRNTIYYGVQTALTVLGGVIIGSSARPYESLRGAALALIVFAVINLVFGRYVAWQYGEQAFVGFMGSKNAYGGLMSLTMTVAAGLFFAAVAHNHRWLAITAGVGACVAGLGLMRSHASGALLGAVAGVALITFINAYIYLTKRVRLGLTIYIVYAVACIGIMAFLFRDSLMSFALHALGKDAGLTGRTDIWAVAQEVHKKHFWLGVGQNAFWVEGNPYAERIWLEQGVGSKKGFPFHNTYYEIAVGQGIIGVAINLVCVSIMLFRQIRATIFTPNSVRACWLVLLVIQLLPLAIESVNFGPISLPSLFMAMGLSFSGARPTSSFMRRI